MRYALIEIELSDRLVPILLGRDDAGYGLLLRLDGDPVHFVLEPLDGPATLGPNDVDQAAGEAGALEILRERIRRELSPPTRRRPISLTVAVCTRDRIEELTRCLDSVLALQATAGESALDVLVIDNASRDEATFELTRSLGVRYAHEPLPGLDFARNRALRESGAEFVAFVDDDARVGPGWLDGLETALAEQPDAAVVTGLVLPLELESEAQILFEQYGGFRRGFQKIRFAGDHLPGSRSIRWLRAASAPAATWSYGGRRYSRSAGSTRRSTPALHFQGVATSTSSIASPEPGCRSSMSRACSSTTGTGRIATPCAASTGAGEPA